MDKGDTVRASRRHITNESDRINAMEVDRDRDASDQPNECSQDARTQSRRELSRLDLDTADFNPVGYRRLAKMEGRLLTSEEEGVLRASERRLEVQREVSALLPKQKDPAWREDE